MRRMILIAIAITMVPASCLSATVQFGWNPNSSDQGVVGYRIYQSDIPGEYNKITHKMADTSQTTATVTVLVEDGRTVYFVATAYDAAGNESGFSNEVSWVVPDSKAPDPPQTLKILERIAKALENISQNGLKVVSQ